MINLYRAVKSNHLNQAFGYNLAYAKLDPYGQPIRPFQIIAIKQGDPTPTGYVPFYTIIGLKGHNGRDWVAYHGEPVYFPATGSDVTYYIEGTCYSEIDADGGKGVDVIFQDSDTKDWYQLKFWHLMDQKVFDGQKIKSGDCIGLADTTGASSGDHLHDGFKPLNSSNLEDKRFPDNGYMGAVDPGFYLGVQDNQATSFILDVLNLKQQLTLLQQIYKLLALLKGRN